MSHLPGAMGSREETEFRIEFNLLPHFPLPIAKAVGCLTWTFRRCQALEVITTDNRDET